MPKDAYLSIESTLLVTSKSIIRSSEAIDSHGDNVSSDSVRDRSDCLGFICGAYELVFICAGTFDCFDLGFDDLLEAVSMSVGVSVNECKCCVEAAISDEKQSDYFRNICQGISGSYDRNHCDCRQSIGPVDQRFRRR